MKKRPSTVWVFLVALMGLPGSTRSEQDSKVSSGPKVYAPGVRIDWQRRLVELDAEIVLREGPLELLACSPHTREHESILRVQARPLHIFQAMGLIGLKPGSPTRFDPKTERWLPATGEPLTLRVRYASKSGNQVQPVEAWLREVAHGRPPKKYDWVFTGSRTLEGEKFGADVDGTAVCVVDFDTALIAVSDRHTADNELLWLEANTDAIPPVGTKCTLLVQSASGKAVDIEVAADGSLSRKGETISFEEVAKLAARSGKGKGEFKLRLLLGTDVSRQARRQVLDSLLKYGIKRENIEVRPVRADDNDANPEPSDDG